MSSKTALTSPYSSTKSASTIRFAFASLFLVVFVTGAFLFRDIGEGSSSPRIASLALDRSKEELRDTVSNRDAVTKSDPHSYTIRNREESRHQQPTKAEYARPSGRLAIDDSKADSTGERASGESTKAVSRSGQPEEKGQVAAQGEADPDADTSELRQEKRSASSVSVLNSDSSGDPDLKTSGGRRMRLPSAARKANRGVSQAEQPSANAVTTSGPDAVQLIGPVSQDQDLRKLPYIPPRESEEEGRLKRHSQTTDHGAADPMLPFNPPSLPPSMPSPIQNFIGVTAATSLSGLIPPDADGDVGPNHYIQSVNSSIQVFSKTGTTLSGPTTFNSFFSALGTSMPCGNNQNDGDGVVFYDHLADRWVVTDFAFTGFPGSSFYECIGVSKTSDPVAGGWWLYSMQVDSANPTFLGDYPKFGLWPDAYYLSVNLFSNSFTFNGVRVYALNRSAMINGTGTPNPAAVAFTIDSATLGDAYSLVPATFRTGASPPAGTPEYFLAINSPATAGTVENQVFAWRFHVDFNGTSTFGVGPSHSPNGTITVDNFVDAFTNTSDIVPQIGAAGLDSLGDRIMYPVVYQNLAGSESLWASHTINNNQNGTGPTAIRWYQFNVTGSTIPATPAQQQTFNNSADGLWRWMPSIAVDGQGNTSIGYSVSGFSMNPAIRYAGRLASDPLNSLVQGEAELIAGGGVQSAGGRWGDYSALSIDPSNNCTFWHTNEVGSSRVDLQACKLEYSIVSPK